MKKRVFVTMFPICEGLGITKDVGQTPQVMANCYGYESYLVTYNNGDDYESWCDKYAPDIKKVIFLQKSGHNTELLDELRFIVKHAREIDVLHTFHIGIKHLICLWVYKILNPKGISYLRLDIDFQTLEYYSNIEPWKKKIIRFLHKGTDIVSAESSETCKQYEKIFGIRPICVPIGFVDIDSMKNINCTHKSVLDMGNSSNKDGSNDTSICKEKIIMTAGRLGTKQKATEILLEAFAKTQNTIDWKLICAGPISEDFNNYMYNFKSLHADVMDRIIFTGNITNKAELYSYMERASIFAMPSRWGGSETVCVEAISKGCYLLMSDQIPPFKEYTNNGEFGMQIPVDDVDAWANGIDTAIACYDKNHFNAYRASQYGKKTFNWKTILGVLENEINKVRDIKV